MSHLQMLLAGYGSLLTVHDLAQVLGWRSEEAEQLLREGELQHELVADGLYVRRDDVLAFLVRRRHFHPPAPFLRRRRVDLPAIGDVVVLQTLGLQTTPFSSVS